MIRHAYSPPKNIANAQESSKPAPLSSVIDRNFLRQVNECFVPAAAAYGYDLRITSGFRTLAEQQQIYDAGRTTDGYVISEAPPGKSLHNYGFAVDVADRWNGYNIDWTRLGKIGAFCGLEQGPVGDYPHFEHRAGLTTADFAAGIRPPPLTLPCSLMSQKAKTGQALTLKGLRSCGAPEF